MALTKRQRKQRLPRGAQQRIADDLGLNKSTVSNINNNKTQLYSKYTVRLVRERISQEIGEPIAEVFGNAA